VEIKNIDNQGRILMTKDWRDRYLKGKKVIIIYKGDTVEIKPFTKSDLTKHFDKVQADVQSDLSDWRKVRKELKRINP
jgi:DNA-binding transcriptional regulator/RsmH inhibitor MraZ